MNYLAIQEGDDFTSGMSGIDEDGCGTGGLKATHLKTGNISKINKLLLMAGWQLKRWPTIPKAHIMSPSA